MEKITNHTATVSFGGSGELIKFVIDDKEYIGLYQFSIVKTWKERYYCQNGIQKIEWLDREYTIDVPVMGNKVFIYTSRVDTPNQWKDIGRYCINLPNTKNIFKLGAKI